MVVDRSANAVFSKPYGTSVALEINNASSRMLRPLKWISKVKRIAGSFLSLNFEEEVSIIHEENTNSASVETTNYKDEQDQNSIENFTVM